MLSGKQCMLVACMLAVPGMAHAGQVALPPEPEAVVREFYAALQSDKPETLTRKLKAISPLLSQDFNRLIADARRAQAEYLWKNPTDKGFLGNGVCFFYGGGDCDFTSYKITRVARAGDKADVTVLLTLVDRWSDRPSDTVWENVVEMKRERGKWVINDVAYFGDKASLSLIEGMRTAK